MLTKVDLKRKKEFIGEQEKEINNEPKQILLLTFVSFFATTPRST